jgi:hypothetical protein
MTWIDTPFYLQSAVSLNRDGNDHWIFPYIQTNPVDKEEPKISKPLHEEQCRGFIAC